MSKLCIDNVIKKDSSNPVVVTFQNGYPSDNLKSTDCAVLEDNTGKKTVLADLDNILYAGAEENNSDNTFLILRNKKTGKTRIINISVVEVKPWFPSDTDEKIIDTSILELNRKFGSKKSKQRVEQREKLKVKIETVTEQLQNVITNMDEEKVDLKEYIKNDSEEFYVPPINRQASCPEEVYDIDRILSSEIFDKVYSEIENKDIESKWHAVIKNLVSMDGLGQKQTVLALYASSLFHLYFSNSKDIGRKSFTICEESPSLNDIVLNNFTQSMNNKRLRPTMYRDKALCYALVLTLILCKFKIPVETLSTHLKMTPTAVIAKSKAAAASITTVGGKKYVQLKLPLPNFNARRRRTM